MNKSIRTAVIGVGNMGANHARVYSGNSNLVAISDLNVTLGNYIANKYGVRYYKNYREMLSKERPQAVSVVVPTISHKDVAIDCLKSKIPTLLEKPLASTVYDAKEIIKTSAEAKTFLMIGHIERFNPVIVEAKKLIENGNIGKIINLLAIRVGISPPKTRNPDVSLDLAIHDVDIFNFLLNSFPKNERIIKSKIFKDSLADWTSIMLEYDSAVGYIQSNWVTPIKMRRLYITGTKAFIEIDYIQQRLVLYNSKINAVINGDFLELVSVENNLKKDLYISKQEPLKKELGFFLKQASNKYEKTDQNILNYAFKALMILNQ